MKYKCELKIKNNLNSILGGSFEIILKYKKENARFYKKALICAYGGFCEEYKNNKKYHSFKEFFISKLQKFNNMSNDEFMKLIKNIINEKEGIEDEQDPINNEIAKLKQSSKDVFDIEI
jgi:hypothetical protein